MSIKERWHYAWRATGISISKELRGGIFAAIAVYIVLLRIWDKDTAMQEVIAIVIAVVAALVLIPISDWTWNFIRALDKLEIERLREAQPKLHKLKELIITVRDRASALASVLESQNKHPDTLKRAVMKYEEALENLNVTATVEGGEIRETIYSGFTLFVMYHIDRFERGVKVVVIGGNDADVNFDCLSFAGKVAGMADQIIDRLKAILLR